MIGAPENNICPMCGGTLKPGTATIPFVLNETMVTVIKSVPAEICDNCREPFLAGQATEQVITLLNQFSRLQSEVSIVSYPEYVAA